MAGLRPASCIAGFRLPLLVEELSQRPAFGIEKMPPEKYDDPFGASQMRFVAGHGMPGEERLEQMHMRIGAPCRLARRRLKIAASLAVLQMRVEEGKRLL